MVRTRTTSLAAVLASAALTVFPACSNQEARLVRPSEEIAADEVAAAEDEAWTPSSIARGAQLIPAMGRQPRPITTASTEAQAFFNQGLMLVYGFNHDEAARAFARAAELDPGCAMCSWGLAYALSANYNMPMMANRAEAAVVALARAKDAAKTASPVEAALIEALTGRIADPDALGDAAALQAGMERHAAAMREVAARFPGDADVQALFAESLMMLQPWHLWTKDGKPGENTLEILGILEEVMAAEPDHLGANHFYIHAIEASPTPQRGIEAADRLVALNPAPGHLVHMPAHIYQRVGRYADAADANRRAIAADLRLFEVAPPIGYYEFYLGHNYGFLAYAASMLGRRSETIAAARNSARRAPMELVCGMPGMDFFRSMPSLARVRFGLWEEILGEPRPDDDYTTQLALWHHARGMALAATGKTRAAAGEAAAIRALLVSVPEDRLAGLSEAREVLGLAAEIVEARVAELEDAPDAIARWQVAVAHQDQLAYNEPADWFYPTRHYLGAALLDDGRYEEAEKVYLADLIQNPDNGWALFGLWKALEGRGEAVAAVAAERRFREAWALADVALLRSAF